MWEDDEKFLSKDKYIRPLIKKYGPCKISVRHKSNYFEDLVDAITSQQLSGKAAATIFGHVKEKCEGKILPEKLIKLGTEELRNCGLSYPKVSYVKDLAERTLDKRLKTQILNQLSDEEVKSELVAVKGIGNWTADMFLMFTLARPDVFPADDLGINKGMVKLLKRPLGKDEILKFAERWKPYRTTASWYIWKLLDNP